MSFRNIVGQDRIVSYLRKALIEKKTSHAFLFEGLRGLGKKTLAFELAKGICCEDEEDKPCGKCSSCVKAERNSNTNIIWVKDEKTIKIEEIRRIQDEVKIKTFDGDSRVYVICDSEKMTIQAQNALLKTLEDPPQKLFFILLTINSNSLLPTIVSRCQLLKLRAARVGEIQKYLSEENEMPASKSKVIAALSNGSIGKAIKISTDKAYVERRNAVIHMTKDIISGSVFSVLSKTDFLNTEKDNIFEIFEMLISWYRDLIIYKEAEQLDYIINCDKIEEIAFQAQKTETQRLSNAILIIEETRANINNNANYQLSLEVMLLNIQEVFNYGNNCRSSVQEGR